MSITKICSLICSLALALLFSTNHVFAGTAVLGPAATYRGGAVSQTTMVSAVTTNTTSAAVAVPAGNKTFYGQVVCSSGACAQTQAIYGDIDSDAANGVLLCTLTLSGTPRAQDACSTSTAPWSSYYIITTATSGTAAAGAVYAMHE